MRFAIPMAARTAAFVTTLALAAPLAAPVLAEEVMAPAKPATMTLSATASVDAVPDMAILSTGVVTQAATARAALSANTKAMTELMGVLEKDGIAKKDIQTSNFRVKPQYAHTKEKDAQGYTKPAKIVGYQVSNTVGIRVRDLDKLGAVLDQLVSAGSNTIGNISFSVSDSSALENDARKKAMQDVLAKARLYADAANVCLARITSITEGGGSVAPKLMTTRALPMAAEAAPVPVAAGEVSYSKTVNVSWELAQGGCQ